LVSICWGGGRKCGEFRPHSSPGCCWIRGCGRGLRIEQPDSSPPPSPRLLICRPPVATMRLRIAAVSLHVY
jgi:hypothetical protein